MLGIQRREVIKQDTILYVIGTSVVHPLDLEQCKVPLAFLWRTYLPTHDVPGDQIELPDLRGGYIDIVRGRKVVVVG